MDNHIISLISNLGLGPSSLLVDLLLNLWSAIGCVVHDSSVSEHHNTSLLDRSDIPEVVLKVHLHLHDGFSEGLVGHWGELTWDDSDS